MLKKRRMELGLTHQDLAQMLSIARNTYTNIELGYKNPSFAIALKIKTALDYYDDEIFLNKIVPKQNKSQNVTS